MKNDSLIYSDILKSLKTVEETEEFSSKIDVLLNSLFKTQAKPLEELLKKLLDLKTSGIIKQAMSVKNINSSDHAAIETLLNDIKKEIQKLRVLKLYLAFDPTTEIIDNIFEWVLKNIGNGIILDIEKDESIIGGAIIVFEGRYKDLTIRKRFEELNLFSAKLMDNLK
ncbi:MAG: F0F1 ATP synthase subunit delta [Patescibacteria group bacterium]|nr:F0F1 ATP synthase subunit delta [Patescibacteria group bacterium]